MTSEMKSSGENARETQQAHSGSQCTVGTGELQGEHQELYFRYLDIKIFQQHAFIEQIALHLTQAGYFPGHSGYSSKQTTRLLAFLELTLDAVWQNVLGKQSHESLDSYQKNINTKQFLFISKFFQTFTGEPCKLCLQKNFSHVFEGFIYVDNSKTLVRIPPFIQLCISSDYLRIIVTLPTQTFGFYSSKSEQ